RDALVEIKARYGCPLVGATLGSKGAVIISNGEWIESRAFEVPGGCRDTTGAGDAFHAGFIYGMLQDKDLEQCLRLGNAVAALKCQSLGARTALPTENDLHKFLTSGDQKLT